MNELAHPSWEKEMKLITSKLAVLFKKPKWDYCDKQKGGMGQAFVGTKSTKVSLTEIPPQDSRI